MEIETGMKILLCDIPTKETFVNNDIAITPIVPACC
jgi:hypothetical protein